jgi:fatty-acyl-CoA synthase
MFTLIKKLFVIGLLTPAGIFRLSSALLSEGTNLMALLKYAARKYKNEMAIVDERETVSYTNLYGQSKSLAVILQNDFKLRAGNKTAFLCRSHANFIRALCAASRIGARVFLLNPEMTDEQFARLVEKHQFDFLFYDREVFNLFESDWKNKSLATNDIQNFSLETLSRFENQKAVKIKPAFSGEIIVLTGGTTGTPKSARRKPSVFNFLNPFFALVTKLHLDRYESVYIAAPAFHGFGIAAIIIGIILGMKMFLRPRFEAAEACDLIEQNRIEVMTVVPLMLQRMLHHDAKSLASIECIISGGAALNPSLVAETQERLGDKLFNLYGTSEAGFSVIAAPEDLRRHPETIGKKISGVNLAILDANDKPVPPETVGKICIKSLWSVKTNKSLVETGDLGFEDENGYLFLRGRTDEMIVSGGENVYPIELENVLIKHPQVQQVAVVGVSDSEFGQRLKAFVVPENGTNLTEPEIKNWLASRVARFQMPVAVEFLCELPTTHVGKINKKLLI